MLAIKLQRIGKKHQPSYRLIIQEKRTKLGGPPAEDLGWFNPLLNKREFKRDRIEYWLKVGAKPTDTVWNLLVSDGIVSGKKRAVHKQAKKEEGAKPAEAKPAAVPKS
ncbi:MAG: 30S ribosomal protein S16 [Patescibacteria group bacterium]